MKLAIIGATGMVGRTMFKILQEHNFPVDTMIPVASKKSIGKTLEFNNQQYNIIGIEEALEARPDIALFSAGGSISKDWAPAFAEKGTYVVDNSSAWRMDPDKKLIIPEINGNSLTPEDKIIANPNCSTIQMLMAIAPIYREYGIERIVASTYQSVTGTGYEAVKQMDDEREGNSGPKVYPHPIDKNALPQCDAFTDNGYTKEEMKLVNESQKILGDSSLPVTATAVRIPVVGGHGESVNLQLKTPFSEKDIRHLLDNTPGVTVQDKPEENLYPMPLNAEGKDEVFAGRIRKDDTVKNGLNMWIVADNLRKGAATNTVQIARYISGHIL